jgi:hypothetical protein
LIFVVANLNHQARIAQIPTAPKKASLLIAMSLPEPTTKDRSRADNHERPENTERERAQEAE